MPAFKAISFIFVSWFLLQSLQAEHMYFAELPETIMAQTGSCLQIPCTFNISDFTKKLNGTKHIHGLWEKNNNSYPRDTVFNSSIIGGFSEIQMIGNLSERNCTTVFYNIRKNQTGDYYFRLEMEPNVFKATFNADRNNPNSSVFKPVKINVTDSPERPKLQNFTSQRTVMEGSTVTLRCSVEALCPQQTPNISWSIFPESANIKPQRQEIKPDQTQSVFSEITFNASYVDHKTNISCTVTYPRPTSTDTVEETMMLRVLFPPKETRVFIKPSASVSVGSEVTLTCRSKMSPTTNSTFIWFRSDRDKPLEFKKIFKFNATQNDTGLYHCVATNKHGNESSAQVLLTVTDEIQLIFGYTGGALTFTLFFGICIFCIRKKTQSKTAQDQFVDNNTATFCQSDDVISSTENETDELNYGEINFYVFQCEQRKAEREPEVSVYSELQVLDRNQPSSNSMDDIYAKVQKK